MNKKSILLGTAILLCSGMNMQAERIVSGEF
jgi:hypothetical protein